MNQGYRDQFTPARLDTLTLVLITHGEISYGHALLRESRNPQTTVEQAAAQALGSCCAANSILISLTKSQRWGDEQTQLPDGYDIKGRPIVAKSTSTRPKIAGFKPTIFLIDEPGTSSPSPLHTLYALQQNCDKSEVAGASLYDKRSLGQWLRDFEQNSLPGESVTDFILRRKNQQKGNSDV